ncbi:MAG TPA: FxSxx-COOH system tetratricopeptide repeat protein [Ktedonobacteraceae bacterium]|nr:FxSxx-COOH system tetratricopeptide repeat protein [Ktedonobacteraceae bacterium]
MSFGARLRKERLRRHLSQEALAEALGTIPPTISRWERDQTFPRAYHRLALCRLFQMPPEELFEELAVQEQAASAPPPLWHVPYPRNPFFTGREEVLQRLHERLRHRHTLALTQSLAVSGLGGIGKTQIALEYAYQYRDDYHYVFWMHADTRESLFAGFITVAQLLHLPEKDERDQNRIIQAVKQWFSTHQDWLLILDNADDVAMVRDYLPATHAGHLLLTSRAQAFGSLAQRIEVEDMGLAEGILFLLRRSKLLAPDASLDQVSEERLAAAEAIVIEMAFLPLALDQAGAYIDEVGCSLSTYLELYRVRRQELLGRRGQLSAEYPESVATTWSLSFQKIEQTNPAAADLLRLCAFLQPDAIPYDLISQASASFGPVLQPVAQDPLKLNEAIKELRQFSLVQYHQETNMLRIHRLVQAVLKDAMSKEIQRAWAQQVVQATASVFPNNPAVATDTWPLCQRYLPQAQSCCALIYDYEFMSVEAASLLYNTASYLQVHALYEQAKPLYLRALQILERARRPEPLKMASTLNNLALLFVQQGDFAQAEPLYLQALRIREQALGPEHRDVAGPLNNLALLYRRQGNYEQAEPLYLRALRILEQAQGPEHPGVIPVLNNLALFYCEQGNYEQAEPLYLRALSIHEQAKEPDQAHIAHSLNGLAEMYRKQGKYEQAEPLHQQALRIWEETLGLEHPYLAYSLHDLALIAVAQGRYEQAEEFFQRALSIREQGRGSEITETATTLHDFAALREKQGNFQEAASLYQRALTIREQAMGAQHPETLATEAAYTALLQAMK